MWLRGAEMGVWAFVLVGLGLICASFLQLDMQDGDTLEVHQEQVGGSFSTL